MEGNGPEQGLLQKPVHYGGRLRGRRLMTRPKPPLATPFDASLIHRPRRFKTTVDTKLQIRFGVLFLELAGIVAEKTNKRRDKHNTAES